MIPLALLLWLLLQPIALLLWCRALPHRCDERADGEEGVLDFHSGVNK